MRSGEQFNIPARNERRIKQAEATEESRNPMELQSSVARRQGWAWTGGYGGTAHPGFGGTNLMPRADGSIPALPPTPCQLPSPLLLLAEVEHSLSGGSGSRPHHVPLAPGPWPHARSSTAAAVGGDARFLHAEGRWEAGEPKGVINGISYKLIVPFLSARCGTPH